MIKKHSVTSGIIAGFILTNGIWALQYDKETTELGNKLEIKTSQLEEKSIQNIEMSEVVGRQSGEINTYKDKIIEINNDKKELKEDLANKNKSIKKQKENIDSLKVQFEAAAKKRNRESP